MTHGTEVANMNVTCALGQDEDPAIPSSSASSQGLGATSDGDTASQEWEEEAREAVAEGT